MKTARTPEWPPLIKGSNVPAWVRLRDAVLTVLAWGLFGFLMRDTLNLAHDYLRPPSFEFSSLSPPDWLELWGRLQPFARFIALLVLWLLIWALVRGRRMRAIAAVPQPAPLAAAVHATAFGLAPQATQPWQTARVLVAHFDAGGQLSHADAVPGDRP